MKRALGFVAVATALCGAQCAQGDDQVTTNFTLTGNHPGGFNIDAKVQGEKQKLPMKPTNALMQYADMAPMDGGDSSPPPSSSNNPPPPMDTPQAADTVNKIFGSIDKNKDGVISPEELRTATQESGNTPAEQKALENLINNATDLGYTPEDLGRMAAPSPSDPHVPGSVYTGGFPASTPPTPQPSPSPASGLAGKLMDQVRNAANDLKNPNSKGADNKPKNKKDDKNYPGKGKFQKPLQDAADKLSAPISP